jgi:hypothetical protein
MIDPAWFARLCCLAEPDIGGRDQNDLLRVLGVEEEVLPYLLISANGFARWPKSRAAVGQVAKGMARSTNVRPEMSDNAISGTQRRALREMLAAQISKSVMTEARPDEAAPASLPVSQAASRNTAPNLFIGAE